MAEKLSKKEIAETLKVKAPTILIVFGATGDLSQNKLFPSLMDLYAQGLLPDVFQIIGFAMDEHSNSSFKKFIQEILTRKRKKYSVAEVNRFLKHIQYQKGLFQDGVAFKELAQKVIDIETEHSFCANKFMYLAIPPKFYGDVLDNLGESGLTVPCGDKDVWSRVLIEKPFGRDVKSANELNEKLKLLFKEDQIFRIDHYLAKETVQNILSFRFSNRLFESIWDNENIDRIEIKLREKKGVHGRGAFYDGNGALRDVGQNHILQLLALITMENPGELQAGSIQEKRAEVLEKLKKITKKTISDKVVRGQYTGYQDEKGVDPDSKTETYFNIQAEIDNDRWRGVPIFLESGKELDETKTKITMYLKHAHCLCPPGSLHPHQNRIVFRIQPNEGISVVFWTKKPGFTTELEEKKLSFYYSTVKSSIQFPDAYEKVLFDTIKGDQTLFASTREVEAQWNYISPIIKNFDQIPLIQYDKDTRGPEKLKYEK